jgi:NAD(P)H-hydrate repair Nnr-like enzyme with NAD(P)H-hydrate epimerase domain
MSKLVTEISHKELIHAWATLMDMSMTLDTLMEKAGSGKAVEIIRFMDDKVKRAVEPLEACIYRIEKQNPDQFG